MSEQELDCTQGNKMNHVECFQWGYCVYCHGCKTMVATSWVQRYYKKPEWLTKDEIIINDIEAQKIPCHHDFDNGESGLGGNRIFICKRCGKTEIDD